MSVLEGFVEVLGGGAEGVLGFVASALGDDFCDVLATVDAGGFFVFGVGAD